MVDGLHAYFDRETRATAARRDGRWDRVHTATAAYNDSVDPYRDRLAGLLGTTEERVKPVSLEYLSGPRFSAPLASNDAVKVTAVRWTVYPGFEAEEACSSNL